MALSYTAFGEQSRRMAWRYEDGITDAAKRKLLCFNVVLVVAQRSIPLIIVAMVRIGTAVQHHSQELRLIQRLQPSL